MHEHATQGRRLIAILKRRGMTMMDLIQTGISVCPWKRIAESLKPGERLGHHAEELGRADRVPRRAREGAGRVTHPAALAWRSQ
jgi:hypothetical protein